MKQKKMLLFLVLLALVLTGCGKKRVTNEVEKITHGIDVARFQGVIDWQQVAQSDIDFVMIRLGYRSSADGSIKEDVTARYNLQEAAKYNIPMGVYFFSTAVSQEEAEEEARWVADFAARYPITYPVVYDCEGFREPDSRQYDLTRGERTDNALAFLKTIEKLGYEGMFYASKNDMEMDSQWEVSRIEEDYKVWVAQYPENPYPGTPASSYSGDHQMWQYSTFGTIPGIDADVDLDIAYFGYDGIEPPKNPEPPEEVAPNLEALMTFEEVSEKVTAKVETNLRSVPSQGDDARIIYTLQNGEFVDRIAVSPSGWSKLIYEGNICYALSSYLTTDAHYVPGSDRKDTDGDGIQTEFKEVNDKVTAKEVVNLRSIPSATREDAKIIAQLKKGEVLTRTGINEDLGWSRLDYNGQTVYCVTQYLKVVE